MGPDTRTSSDIEADVFFAQFNGASPNVVARIIREGGGNLEEIVREDLEYGYWSRMVAARQQRQATRALDAWRVRAEQDDIDPLRILARKPVDPDRARLVILPAPRIATLTEDERRETTAWWGRLEQRRGVRGIVRRIRTEVRDARDADRFAERANAAWRAEQRAFERAQWRETIARRNARPAMKRAQTWSAISEERALAIAIAALEHATPPHHRN